MTVAERAPEWLVYPLERESLQVLYGSRVLEPVDVGLPVRSDPEEPRWVGGLSDSFPVYIDETSSEYKELFRWMEYMIASVGATFAQATISDFVVPQMVYRALVLNTVKPVWDFNRLYYGRH